MYAYWVCAARETPIFSPKFPFRSISFSQITKKSSPEHHHFTFFAVPETIIFKIALISTHSSPPTTGSAPTQSVLRRPGLCQPDASSQFRRPAFPRSTRLKLGPEPHISTLNTAQARSWSPAFPRSTRLKLGPEPRIFTLDRGARSGARAHFSLFRGTYLPKFGVSTPPPPSRVLTTGSSKPNTPCVDSDQ